MKIDEIRIYAEVLEQGIDFKDYFLKAGLKCPIKNVYAKKGRNSSSDEDNLITRLRNAKDVDVLISVLSDSKEIPFLMVEYSTAVPTDDHKMQRSDVYFWAGLFGVPELKISPDSIGMNQDFGGGDRINDEHEKIIALRHNAILFQVPWHTVDTFDVLETKENCLSCIYYSKDIFECITFILSCFDKANDFETLKMIELQEYKKNNRKLIEKYEHDNLHNLIVNSTRFNWDLTNNLLVTKINRFGHAMDPDRGVLFFINMLVGFEHAATEIQVNRKDNINARGGYKSLFDSTSKEEELINYVSNIIRNRNNVFTDTDAIHVFRTALNIPDDQIPFRRVRAHEYQISDEDLLMFLLTYPSITTKTIFILTSELRLTDKNRNVICRIKWNRTPSNVFLSGLVPTNLSPIKIRSLNSSDMKEDLITYASVELYKRLNLSFTAVSYPGAQGDRAILTGSGRNVDRTYVDIIAYKKENNSFVVFLEECKDNLSKSQADIQKLKTITSDNEYLNGLKALFRKTIQHDNFRKIYKSIGGKTSARNLSSLDVDYIFMFEIENNNGVSSLKYSIAIIDLGLVGTFKVLENKNHKLTGNIELEDVYIIE